MNQLNAFPELAALLQEVLVGQQALLGKRFLAFYLGGSLALGDFNPATSDVDFLVVTGSGLATQAIARLAELHARLGAASHWGAELEGSYVPCAFLNRTGRPVPAAGPEFFTAPRIERGGKLAVEPHHSDWLIQRHILREQGIVLSGPGPQTLLDPVSPLELRRAVMGIFWWWEQQLADTRLIAQSGYQAYAILTMARILYTLEHGVILSKPAAARWAQEILPARWASLLAEALAWQPGAILDRLPETQAYIRYTLETSRARYPQLFTR